MRPKYLIIIIIGLICLTISLIDVLSTKTVRADEGMSRIAIETLVYLVLGIAGIILIAVAIVQLLKQRKHEKEIHDSFR